MAARGAAAPTQQRQQPRRRRPPSQRRALAILAVAASSLLLPAAAAFLHCAPSAARSSGAVARHAPHRHPPAFRAAARPRQDDEEEGDFPSSSSAAATAGLLDRRELLVPALLSLGSGIAILTNGIRDERAYDAEHRALFGAIEDPAFRRVLEIGIGEGPNVLYYPKGCTVTGTDPYLKRDALSVAQNKAKARGVTLKIEEAAAEQLPFPDGSFDAAVSTLVFCTVRDPSKALREIHRVLRPGGKFLFVEHIWGEEGTFLRAQQRALDPLQQLLAGGCHLTRETDKVFLAATAGGRGEGGEKGEAPAAAMAAAAGGRGDGGEKGDGEGEGEAPVKALFSRVERLDYLEQGSKWPIVRQVAGVLVK